MKKEIFLEQLERLLQDIPQQERQEALQYYRDYFDDAGPENEQAVMEALGNPARVAESIRRDLSGGEGELFEDRKVSPDREMIKYEGSGQAGDGKNGERKSGSRLSAGVIVLIVVLAVFAGPVLVMLSVCLIMFLVSLLIGIAAFWFGIAAMLGGAAIGLLAAAIVLAVTGSAAIPLHPMAGTGVLGVGLLLAGVGILFLVLLVLYCGVVTPAVFRGIGKLFSLIKSALKRAKKAK